MLLRTLTFIRKHVLNYYLLNKTLNIRTSRITILFCLVDDVNVDFRDADNWKLFNFIITFAFWIRRDIDGWNYLEYSSIFPALTATASDCHHENERKLDVESWPDALQIDTRIGCAIVPKLVIGQDSMSQFTFVFEVWDDSHWQWQSVPAKSKNIPSNFIHQYLDVSRRQR